MAEFIAYLDHWQTLLGSILGGLVALLAALIVARTQTRREQRAAAILLISDLLAIDAHLNSMRGNASKNRLSDDEYREFVVKYLLK